MDHPVRAVPHVAAENLLTHIEKLLLVRPFVQEEEHISPVESLHRLDGDMPGISRADADNSNLPHVA